MLGNAMRDGRVITFEHQEEEFVKLLDTLSELRPLVAEESEFERNSVSLEGASTFLIYRNVHVYLRTQPPKKPGSLSKLDCLLRSRRIRTWANATSSRENVPCF